MTGKQFQERLQLTAGLLRQGYYRMALEIGRELYEHKQDDAPLLHTMGQIATSLGQFHDALDYHRQ